MFNSIHRLKLISNIKIVKKYSYYYIINSHFRDTYYIIVYLFVRLQWHWILCLASSINLEGSDFSNKTLSILYEWPFFFAYLLFLKWSCKNIFFEWMGVLVWIIEQVDKIYIGATISLNIMLQKYIWHNLI